MFTICVEYVDFSREEPSDVTTAIGRANSLEEAAGFIAKYPPILSPNVRNIIVTEGVRIVAEWAVAGPNGLMRSM